MEIGRIKARRRVGAIPRIAPTEVDGTIGTVIPLCLWKAIWLWPMVQCGHLFSHMGPRKALLDLTLVRHSDKRHPLPAFSADVGAVFWEESSSLGYGSAAEETRHVFSPPSPMQRHDSNAR